MTEEMDRMLALMADAERGTWPDVEVEEPLPPGLKERVWERIKRRWGKARQG